MTNDVDDNKTITCFKCHGEGTYKVPILDVYGGWTGLLKHCHCDFCCGTGKITLKAYEWFQKGMRDKE